MVDFAELVEAEGRGLQAAVTAIVGDRHRAEEIVQDAFERCFVRWRRVSRLDRPGAWARRVAINEAISVTRRRSSEQRAVERLGARDVAARLSGPDPLAACDDESVWAAVRALPGGQAAAIALRYGADLSVEDIAETMRTTTSAVKSLLHRARASLRTSVALQMHVDGKQACDERPL
jgi:RNA polymerase sigma factor (sigma-70 family)